MAPSGAFLCHTPNGPEADAVLLHPHAPRWVIANATTREILPLLANPEAGEEAAAQHLHTRYDIPLEAARRDVAAVCQQLHAQGMFEAARIPAPPRLTAMYLVLTECCNLACTHCLGAYPAKGELPLTKAMALVDEFVELGGRSLVLSGGEPLLYSGLDALMAHIGKRLPAQICTNGTLLDAAWARRAAEELDPTFQISLDGPDAATHDAIRGTGAFEGALRGIRTLQDAGLGKRITLATTIQRGNLERLPELVHLAVAMGIPRVRFVPVREEGRARECWECTGAGLDEATYARIFDQFLSGPQSFPKEVEISCGLSGFSLVPPPERNTDENWCPLGDQLVVDASGETYPCTLMLKEPFGLGSVHNQSLSDLMAGERLLALHAAKVQRKSVMAQCQPCTWKNFCQGGCMAQAFDAKGELWTPDPSCGYRQTAYTRAFNLLLEAANRRQERD